MNLWKKFYGVKRHFFGTHATTIDNCVFRLHYKVTAFILFALSIVVLMKQHAGDPIHCLSKDDIPEVLLDTFCSLHATFSVSDAWEKNVGGEIPYPGIDKYRPSEKRVFHNYYYWVGFMLCIQGIIFFLPRYFWKAMEGGRVKSLIFGLNLPVLPEDIKLTNQHLLVQYMVKSMNKNSVYFMSYTIAEVLNFINVVGQFFLMNAFLGGEFLTYGSNVVQFPGWESDEKYNPMTRVFPRLTKCTFHRYGSSGDVHRHDAVCVLSTNILNAKIYLFLWFWFVGLAILSGLVLLYRAAVVFLPKTRVMVTRYRARFADQEYLEAIIMKCKIGDWFLLDLLSKNLEPLNFSDVINDFAVRLNCAKSDNV